LDLDLDLDLDSAFTFAFAFDELAHHVPNRACAHQQSQPNPAGY
jgi:hypothetical protein